MLRPGMGLKVDNDCKKVEDPVDEELDPRSRLREYVDSKRKLVAKKLCYAKPTRSSWPLKQGRMGDLSQLKEDLEQKITTWQREVDLKLTKSRLRITSGRLLLRGQATYTLTRTWRTRSSYWTRGCRSI